MEKNKTILIVILLGLLISSSVLARTLPVVAPEDVGMSSERLDRLNKVMVDYVRQGKMPGAVTLVVRRGKIAHFQAYGMMDIEAKK